MIGKKTLTRHSVNVKSHTHTHKYVHIYTDHTQARAHIHQHKYRGTHKGTRGHMHTHAHRDTDEAPKLSVGLHYETTTKACVDTCTHIKRGERERGGTRLPNCQWRAFFALRNTTT